MKASHLPYKERAPYCLSPLAKRLFNLMDEKKTNLAFSADVTSAQELLELADTLGNEICILKTHIDIINDFTPKLTKQLHELAVKHRFYVFEDRKFADIGNTVKYQYEGGIYRIADWADIVNAHSLPGPSILKGLAEVGRKKNRAIILIAELSSEKHLMTELYMRQTLAMAEQFSDITIGFITQHALCADPHWINFTPGVKLETGNDQLGQQYITPKKAILENGSDVIIVGRGILKSQNRLEMAQAYREQGWLSYLERCNT